MFASHAGASVVFGGIAILGSVFAFLKLFRLRTMNGGHMVFFFVLTFIYLLFYGFFFSWSLRYVLFLYPIVFLLFLKILFEFFPVRFCMYIVIFCCSIFYLSQWNLLTKNSISLYGEAIDLRSIAQQDYMRKIISEILSFDQKTIIYTDFQLAHYLWSPIFGYIKTNADNVFQIQQPTAYDNCPTCKCSRCVSTNSLPKNKKQILVFMTGIDYPWIQDILKKSKVIKTIKPDWPNGAIDEFTLYEYYDQSE
jgi:hypothetical protein